MNKQETINKIKGIDNIFKYSIKGGTAMFNREYPELLNSINEHTKEMQVFAVNKKLVPKITFLKKYSGDINNITHDGKIMLFDYKTNDFKIANINAAQKQWDICKDELSTILEIYTKEETLNLLKNNYITYFGKSGNRKLLRDNKKLYLSLYQYTQELNSLNRNLNKFSMRLYIFVNNIDIYCHEHKCNKFWKFNKSCFYIICPQCEPIYPSIEWFKKKYGVDWTKYHDLRVSKVKLNKCNGLQWFILKYGDDLGEKNYKEYVTVKMNNLCELKANKYSKISQDLFWKIYEKLSCKDKTYFYELNQEFVIRIPLKYKHENTVMMLDFKQNKKIIEYNGNYWHSKNKDDIRYSILKDIGFEVMVVTSDEYNRNKKSKEIIDKCVNFLQ